MRSDRVAVPVSAPAGSVAHTNVLGIKISLIDLARAVGVIAGWIARREAHYVCIRDAHGIILAQDDPVLRRIHHDAGMVTPDGMPVLWLAKFLSKAQIDRVYGPDLLEACLGAASLREARHFFFGGGPDVAQQLIDRCRIRYPGMVVAGQFTPPFGAWSKADADAAIEAINAARPDIVWVGLGTPKQEYWMSENTGRIPGAVLIGVGAAFDFLAGLKPQAPRWMQRNGVEWIFRLISEPRRLWRRYLKTVPRFLVLAALQVSGVRRFPAEPPPRIS